VRLDRIRRIHVTSQGSYGAPRSHAELAAAATPVGRQRVARPRRTAGLAGIGRRRWTGPTRRAARARPAPALVERDCSAERPDRPWLADITDVASWAGFRHLAVVLDAFGRRVVGWAMADHLRTRLVLDALAMALGPRRPDDVSPDSDQGAQDTALAFGQRCREAGLRPSMGAVGAAAAALGARVFAPLACELIDRRRLRSLAAARLAVFTVVEAWSNPRRRHSALGHL
jgi:putative transposase